jgi:phage baseplate assembly protein W
MAQKFLGVGWKFPVEVNMKEGKVALSKYEDDIKEAIWIILSTAKGERVMRPSFGCGIHEMVFQTLNMENLSIIERTVREALTLYEPRIEIARIDINLDQAQLGKLLIGIDYTVRSTNNQFNIVYPFYLNEGK